MSGWEVFWLCFCILLAAPSTSGLVKALEDIARSIREANALKRQELQQPGKP